MKAGKLFLIPTYLDATNDASFIAPQAVEVIQHCAHYLVENERTARRYISSLKTGLDIASLLFHKLDKRSQWDELYPLFEPVRKGADIGLISEAGLPCLADPGNLAVSFAHQTGIQVVPLPGASSIQMALIASGFNGQHFTFHGYLPIDKAERRRCIKDMEKQAQLGVTQLFMETPYRNKALLSDLLSACHPNTLLSVAAGISSRSEQICTQSISKWKKSTVDIHKIPALFSLGQFP